MSDVPTDGGVSPDPAHLPELIVGLTESVEGLREDFRAERAAVDRKFITAAEAVRRVNRQTVAIAAVAVVVFLALGMAVNAIRNDRDAKERSDAEALVTNCINGNATRVQIVNLFDVYTVTLGQLTPSSTPEAQAAKDQVISRMRSNFQAALPPELGPRDCSVQAVTTPTTFPPPTTVTVG